ncbi:MAG: hypothetical protein CMD58_04650 [Gammaproteobacteria bacterium]|nr:hypothetical protein [Gammaproteobacteria bacterium]
MTETIFNLDVLDIKFSDMLSKMRNQDKSDPHSSLNIAFLRNITIEPMIPFFEYQCMTKGVKANTYLCDFDNIMQDILDKNSGLYKHEPKIIFIFIKLEEIAPKLCLQFPELTSSQITKHIEDIINYYKSMFDALRRESNALIVFNNFEVHPFPSGGILDYQKINGLANTLRQLNQELLILKNSYSGILLLDLDMVASRIGFINFQNNMQWHMSKMPFSNLAMRHISSEAAKYVTASEGDTKKCIVLDCDNTLWGGVVGEDGTNGITLDQNHPGSYYIKFQKDLLNLKSQGVLLAICSKNNESDVLSVFQDNENMVLKENDFSCMRINWNLKPDNIKEIAKDLNIGLQHIVFIDDSDFEIEMVTELLPEVTSILVPKNLSELNNIFDGKGYFDKIQDSGVDTNRTEMYLAESQRKKELDSKSSLEDYYNSLEIEARVGIMDSSDLPRVAQLTQKTNQFNLTTIRYTEQDIYMLSQSKDSDIVTLKADDKFGAYGLIGVAILRYIEETLEIDSFLLSCRAIGRGLEDVLLEECIKHAKSKEIKFLSGSFSKTQKNSQVEYFFENHGFDLKTKESSKKSYLCEIDILNVVSPKHIKVL